MQKRPGGKMLLRQIDVPEDSKLMLATRSAAREATREQDDLKSFIMQSVEDAAAPPTRSFASSSMGAVKMRAGKGGYKGSGKARRNGDYLKDDFLPEDDRPEPPPSHGTPSGRAIQ